MKTATMWSHGRRFWGIVAGWTIFGIVLSAAAASADSVFQRRSSRSSSSGVSSSSRSGSVSERRSNRDSNRSGSTFERRSSPFGGERSFGRTPSDRGRGSDLDQNRERDSSFGRRDNSWNSNRPRSDRSSGIFSPRRGDTQRDNTFRRSQERDNTYGSFRRRSDPAPGAITDGKQYQVPSSSVERSWRDLERSGRIRTDRRQTETPSFSNRPTPAGPRGRDSGGSFIYPRADSRTAFGLFGRHEKQKKVYRYQYNRHPYVRSYYYPYYCTNYDPYYTYPSVYFHFYIGPYPRYIYRDRVVVINRPVYISDYDDDDDDYYLSSSSREISVAIEDIRKAWLDRDIESLMRHVRSKDKLSVYFKGEYSYSISPEDYYDMTLDAMDHIYTRRFDVDQVVKKGSRRAYIYAVHDYEDPDGERQTIYVSFTLERYQGQWWITGIGSSSNRSQWHIH